MPKKLIIKEKDIYVVGRDSDRITITFKIFMSKRQTRTSKTVKVDTTVGEFRNVRVPCLDNLTKVYPKVLYLSHDLHIIQIFKLFKKLGIEIDIHKKYNYNVHLYINSIYDCLLEYS